METEAEIGVCIPVREVRMLGIPQSLEMAEKSSFLEPSGGA